jgi:hypothetical protein
MAYQPQVPADTLSSAARGYKTICEICPNWTAERLQLIPDGLVSALNDSALSPLGRRHA